MASFLGEIRRRQVFQIAAVYIVVAWLLMQVVDVIDEPLRVPEWFATVVLLLLAIGFPVALVLSWAYELTPDGIVRDEPGLARGNGRAVEYVLIGVLFCAVLWLLYRDINPTDVSSTALPNVTLAQPENALRQNGIAILPFENMSVDPDDAFFAAGIHDEIINQVSKIDELDVLARTSVMQFAGAQQSITEIARALDVANLLAGSVSYSGDQVRVRAQLIDGATGANRWTQVFQADLADVFGIYADISARIADSLEAELLPSERARIARAPTTSLAAYGLYLQARETQGEIERVDEALALLDRAIAADESFALAHASKAQILGFRFVDQVARAAADPSRDAPAVAADLERTVVAHAERALEIDSELGLAYSALAMVHMRHWRKEPAEIAFSRALELSPNDVEILHWYSLFSSWTGQYERAIALHQRASDLGAGYGLGYLSGNLSDPYFWAGDADMAARMLRDAISVSPSDGDLYFNLAEVEAARGEYAAAVENLEIAEQLTPIVNPGSLARAAYVYALSGNVAEAERLVAQVPMLTTPPSPIQHAVIELAIGNVGECLRLLQEYIDSPLPFAGATLTYLIKLNVYDDPLLEQPEFRAIRQRLGFQD